MRRRKEKRPWMKTALMCRNFVQGVVCGVVEQGFALGGADAGEMQLMDVAFDEAVNDEARASAIGGHPDFFDAGSRLVHLRAAVAALVNVGESSDGIAVGPVRAVR